MHRFVVQVGKKPELQVRVQYIENNSLEYYEIIEIIEYLSLNIMR